MNFRLNSNAFSSFNIHGRNSLPKDNQQIPLKKKAVLYAPFLIIEFFCSKQRIFLQKFFIFVEPKTKKRNSHACFAQNERTKKRFKCFCVLSCFSHVICFFKAKNIGLKLRSLKGKIIVLCCLFFFPSQICEDIIASFFLKKIPKSVIDDKSHGDGRTIKNMVLWNPS